MKLLNLNWYPLVWMTNNKSLTIAPAEGIMVKDLNTLPIVEGVYYIVKESDFLSIERPDVITQDYASAKWDANGHWQYFTSFIMKPTQE